MASYTWHINDRILAQKIKDTKISREAFFSPIFRFFNLNWQLELQPNVIEDDEQSKALVFLNLKALSPKIESVRVQVIYTFFDMEIQFDRSISCDHLYANSWEDDQGVLARQKILEEDEFVIQCDFELLAVFDQNGEDLTQNYLKNDANDPQPEKEEKEEKVDIDDEKEDSMKDDEKEQQMNQMDVLVMQMKKMAAQIEKIQETVNDLQIKCQDEQKTMGKQMW